MSGEKSGEIAGPGWAGVENRARSGVGNVEQTIISLFRVSGQGLKWHQGPGTNPNV